MSSPASRRHHYLSQFYLKGFTNGRSKKSKLIVFDNVNARKFETIPRNVGGVRDFNRIKIEGMNPDFLEGELAKFEGQVATALKAIETKMVFEGENKDLILNFIALLAVRSPDMRERVRKFHAEIAELLASQFLCSKDRWESRMDQLKAEGHEIPQGVAYEQAKEFYERKEYKINVAREWHIQLELEGMGAILPCLYERRWVLARRSGDSGPFMTTDRPVALVWTDPDSIPPLFRDSPGYAMQDTLTYFPLSQDVALVGAFDIQEGVINVDEMYVAHVNTLMMHKANRNLYAPNLDFPFVGQDGQILSGRDLLAFWRTRK